MQGSLEDKVNLLVDRAEISDLLFSFARALDTKDIDAYVANYADGGELQFGGTRESPEVSIRKEEIPGYFAKTIATYPATHHISANHEISIDGDSAVSRSYATVRHVVSNPKDFWGGGGWYDCEYTRTDEGWKFTFVRLSIVWAVGEQPDSEPDAISN